MYVKTWMMKESVCIQLSAVLQLQTSFTLKSVYLTFVKVMFQIM